AGQMSRSFSVVVRNDRLIEGDETFRVLLSNATGAVVGSASSAVLTIQDDDGPTVAFRAIRSQGSEATTSVQLAVALSRASTVPVSVSYAGTGGTATAGEDYTLPAGTLTFSPGQTLAFIDVTVNNDVSQEANETIQVTLSAPLTARLGAAAVHTYTIFDNDQ